jgi:hypothetical protein
MNSDNVEKKIRDLRIQISNLGKNGSPKAHKYNEDDINGLKNKMDNIESRLTALENIEANRKK